MKSSFILCVVFIMVISTACTSGESNMFLKKQDANIVLADESMDKVLDAIQNKNTQLLFSVFSKNALVNTEETMDILNRLYSYYHGNCISYDNWGGPNVEVVRENDQRRKELYATYDINTGISKYRVAFLYIAEDTADPQNVGMWSMYIINWDDDTDTWIAYRGDGNYLPGIHIGVKNVLPNEGQGDILVSPTEMTDNK